MVEAGSSCSKQQCDLRRITDHGAVGGDGGIVTYSHRREQHLPRFTGARLRGLDGISFTFFTARDVVRHPLVARIVHAYDRRDGKESQE